jgi:hypothetical protein
MATAPVFSRDPANMQELGSGRAVIREVNSDGSLLSATQQTAMGYGGTGPAYGWMELPIIKSSVHKDETTVNKKADEGGDKYPIEGERDVTFEITAMQRENDIFDNVLVMRGRYFEIVKENSSRQLKDGFAYVHFAVSQIEPKVEAAFPGGEPKMMFNILPVPVAIVNRDLSDIDGMRAPFTGITVSYEVGDYHKRFSIKP